MGKAQNKAIEPNRHEELAIAQTRKAKEFKIPPLSLPVSLDKQFQEFISDIKDCLLFLERYAEDEPIVAALIEAYKSDGTKFTKDFSLDNLVTKAKVDPNVFRRLMFSTIDYLCSDDADMSIRLSKASLVRKSLSIAMDESLPESAKERERWLEFMGYRAVSKNSTLVNVNVSPQQTTNIQQNVVNGLPSFSSTMNESEKIVGKTVKELIADTNKNVIDMSTITDKDLLELENV